MINQVLEHLERLQNDLAAIDPQADGAAAARVADIAKALRDNLAGLSVQNGPLSRRLAQLRHMDETSSQAA